MADFYGFSFNGVHFGDGLFNVGDESSLPIYRVSGGNRYTDDLLPSFQDVTSQITGNDGTYYWNSFFTQKVFQIQIAFDHLLETDYHKLTKLLSTKDLCPLIFDEAPYKKYMVKVNNVPQLQTICFDEIVETSTQTLTYNKLYNKTPPSNNNVTRRVYKGEGTLGFIAFYPFALSTANYLNQIGYTQNSVFHQVDNISDWNGAIELPANSTGFDTTGGTGSRIPVRGERDFDIIIKISISNNGSVASNLKIRFSDESLGYLSVVIPKGGLQTGDTGIQYNSRTQLLEGYSYNSTTGKYTLTGTLYNQYITGGDFFKCKCDVHEGTSGNNIFINGSSGTNATIQKLEYSYVFY